MISMPMSEVDIFRSLWLGPDLFQRLLKKCALLALMRINQYKGIPLFDHVAVHVAIPRFLIGDDRPGGVCDWCNHIVHASISPLLPDTISYCYYTQSFTTVLTRAQTYPAQSNRRLFP